MIKNYIWDFDGMLFDSYRHITACFVKAMSEFGVTVDYDESKSLFEISYKTCFEHYGCTDEMIERFDSYESDYHFEPVVSPFKNTVFTLNKIVKNGGKNFLYTHRDHTALYYLAKYNVINLFDGFVTSLNNFPSKPSPDALNYIAETFNLNKKECLMIGDREIDVGSGYNAGMYSCLCSKGVKDTVADFVISDISEVLDIKTE